MWFRNELSSLAEVSLYTVTWERTYDLSSMCEICGYHGSVAEHSSLLGLTPCRLVKHISTLLRNVKHLRWGSEDLLVKTVRTLESQSSIYFTTVTHLQVTKDCKALLCYFIRSYFIIIIIITTTTTLSVLRQVYSLFQSAFSRMRALVLPLLISFIFWFP